MNGVLELLPHDMGLRVELDTNETYYLKSGWAERCDGIYGLACVRSWLKDNFGHDFGTERFVMPQNAAGTWLVEPKALGPMWSETCQMNFQWLFRETVLNTSLMDSINLHGVMKPIIIDGTKTNRVRKFEIVDGYHRLIAASMLGLKIPVCLIDMSAKGTKPSNRLIKDFLEALYSKEDTK